MSIEAIVMSLGGAPKVGQGLGIAPSVVNNWCSRGRIPARWWAPLVRLAIEFGVNGITLEVLAGLHDAEEVR